MNKLQTFASACFLCILVITALLGNASPAYGVSCSVIHHPASSDADKALLNADYPKAESLYRQALTANRADENATTGLVHALLRQQKVQDAADAVQAALSTNPKSAALLVLRGEVEYRQGVPWTAADTMREANKLDSCNPRLQLLVADIARISSLYATAQTYIKNAHLIDPDDPEITQEWIGTLPLKERIAQAEAYLAAPHGDDPEDLRHLHSALDHWKKLTDEPRKSCHLVSGGQSAEIPFANLMEDATHVRAVGLDVKLNNRGARLEIDTGAGGLVVNRGVAQRAGLKAFSHTTMGGIGDNGEKAAYTAYADSIRIGGLEFADCMVEVLDDKHGLDQIDGLIGMDVFSRFLVTLDYPMRKLILSPLPPRPDQTQDAGPSLNTAETASDEPDSSEETQNNPAATPPAPKKAAAPRGPQDRYIAPEMKDYTKVYRVGHDIILPAALNSQKVKLFIMDTGAWATTISPQAAREVTKVHNDHSGLEVSGISGKVDKIYTANKITFRFANLSQEAEDVVAFDTSRVSKNVGMEISGFIGARTLRMLTIHIDYRDGLVKFDYDPNRGYRQ